MAYNPEEEEIDEDELAPPSMRASVSQRIQSSIQNRYPSSANVMKKSFPNYYKKFGLDPSAVTPPEYFKDITQQQYQGKSDGNYNGILAKDLFGDSSLESPSLESKIRSRNGFREDEIPVITDPKVRDQGGVGMYSRDNKSISIMPDMPSEERASVLMHEFEHAKDDKAGFRGTRKQQQAMDYWNSADAKQRVKLKSLINEEPEDLFNYLGEGHHKDFKNYNLEYPQYAITKEHINQNSGVNPSILDKYPELRDLQKSQQDFNVNIKQPYIDRNSTENEFPGEMKMNNRTPQSYFDGDFSRERNKEKDAQIEDKTPYDSISSRAPIANPMGENAALDGDTDEEDLVPPPNPGLQATGMQLQKLQDSYNLKAPPGPQNLNSVRSNVAQMIQARKMGGNPGLNPGNQAAIDRMKAGMGEPSSMPMPIPEEEEQVDNAQPMPSPSPELPGSADPGHNRAPMDYAGLIPNGIGNYALAGAMMSRGALTPLSGESVGNAINQQNAQARKGIQATNIKRNNVLAAIAKQKAAQAFTAGQNDLNRANSKDIANIRVAGRPNTQDHFDQNMDFKQKKYHQGRFDSLNSGLSEELARGNTPFAIAARNKQAIDNVRQLISGKADPNDLNPQEVFEAAKSLDRVLSQGNPTAASTGHLTPNNAGTWIAEALQHVSNSTKGANAGEYITNMSKTLDREYQQANKTLSSARNKRMSTVQDLKKIDPQQWNEIMTRHGINEDGTEKPIAKTIAKPATKQINENGVIKTLQQSPDGLWDEVE